MSGDLLRAPASGAPPFQSIEERRAELLADLVSAAWGAHGEFIDADQFLSKPTVLRRLAAILAGRVPPDTDRLLGREPHSLVLGAALTLETGLPLVIARVTDSTLRCFGELHPGERVLVVEGVTGTGGSAEGAVVEARRRGAVISRVLAAVDRDQGATARLAEVGVTLETLFADSELRANATRSTEGGR